FSTCHIAMLLLIPDIFNRIYGTIHLTLVWVKNFAFVNLTAPCFGYRANEEPRRYRLTELNEDFTCCQHCFAVPTCIFPSVARLEVFKSAPSRNGITGYAWDNIAVTVLRR